MTALVVVVVLSFLLHLVVIAPMTGPLIYPDELGYWYHARKLAGAAPRIDPYLGHAIARYHPGYGLVLLPTLLWSSSPAAAYKSALVLNALLLSTLPVLLYGLARRFAPRASDLRRLAAACVVALYPTYLLHAAFTMAEAIIPAVIALLLLGAFRAMRSGRGGAWLALGAAGGLAFVVHRRLLAVTLAIVVCAALWRGRRRWLPLGAASVGAALGLALAYAAVRVMMAPTIDGAAVHAGAVLGSYGESPSLAATVGATAAVLAGHLFYLSAATWGLLPIGLGRGLLGLGRVLRSGKAEPREGLAALAALLLCTSMPVHALFLRTRLQQNYLLHGRYNEALMAPLVLLGLFAILELRRRQGRLAAVLVVVGGVTAACYAAAELRAGGRLLYLPNDPVDDLAIYPFLVAPWGGYNLVVLQVLALSGLALLLATWRRPRVGGAVGLVALALWFGTIAYYDTTRYLAPGSAQRFRQRTLVPLLERATRLEPAPPIFIDRPVLQRWDWGWHAYNYVFFVDADFRTTDLAAGEPAAGLLVTRRPDVPRFVPGARLAGYEPGPTVLVWVTEPAVASALRGWWPLPPSDQALRLMRPTGEKVFRPLPFNTEDVYADNGWTDGDGTVRLWGYRPAPEDRYLELRTHGLRMRHGPPPVTVAVDGRVLPLRRVAGTSYFFALTDEVESIDRVRIRSSTFAPMQLGGDDRRSLGIDVAAIAFRGEQEVR